MSRGGGFASGVPGPDLSLPHVEAGGWFLVQGTGLPEGFVVPSR